MTGRESLALYEAHAREVAGMPADWHAWLYRWLPEGAPPGHPDLRMGLTGAVAPPHPPGHPREGTPDWGKKDWRTVREVEIWPGEHETWLAERGEAAGGAAGLKEERAAGNDGGETS